MAIWRAPLESNRDNDGLYLSFVHRAIPRNTERTFAAGQYIAFL
jgi:hypothetical protein